MLSLRQTQLGLATITLTVFLGLSSTGEGYKQELWMYTEEGNGLYFHTHVPDLSSFSSTLPKITRACVIGKWDGSVSVNHQNSSYLLTPYLYDNQIFCTTLNAANLKSLRYEGANETLTDAVSLYSGPGFYNGDEILVTSNAKTDISVPIHSFAATGTAAWMLHEGKNLDGKSVCLKAPAPTFGSTIRYAAVPSTNVNLTTIGSIFKGCDARKIQLYKESHVM